jgi:hypothetical protein
VVPNPKVTRISDVLTSPDQKMKLKLRPRGFSEIKEPNPFSPEVVKEIEPTKKKLKIKLGGRRVE